MSAKIFSAFSSFPWKIGLCGTQCQETVLMDVCGGGGDDV